MLANKNVSHIILEGCDGVGKDSIGRDLLKYINYTLTVYPRGEISDFVYAKKFNRNFVAKQRKLPFLYVILTKSEEELTKQILNRKYDEGGSLINSEEELEKIKDQKLFLEAYEELKNDYNIIKVDCTGLTINQSVEKVYSGFLTFVNNINHDQELNTFNQMYAEACKRLGYTWHCVDNQPYLNGKMVMTDAQYNLGAFETFDNKSCPDNLIYASNYTNTQSISYKEFQNKPYDFAYPINSKILYRDEINDYIYAITKNNTLYTSNSQFISNNSKIYKFDKAYKDDYIEEISKAKATVYIGREIAYLRMLTARCYESALSNQIMFVDKLSDPDCSLLKQIYKDNQSIIDLLYIDENTLIDSYNKVINNHKDVEYILERQHIWYNDLLSRLNDKTL